MMHCYKRYIVIGISVMLIIFCLMSFEEGQQSFQYYYGTLYNRACFILYLITFLIGMIPIASRLFIPELAVRYCTKTKLIKSLYKRLGGYVAYFAGLFLVANLIVTVVSDPNFFVIGSGHYRFLLCAYLCQAVGWFFVGSLFLMLYAFCKNMIVAYLMDGLIIMTLISLAKTAGLASVKQYINVYEMMYLFFQIPNLFHLVLCLLYYCLLSVGVFGILFGTLKRGDLLSPLKGER